MLYIASDHGGFKRKQFLLDYLSKQGIKCVDLGTHTDESTDFPIYAKKLVAKVLENKTNRGILVCGSGVGMSICANRFKGIRAGLCTTPDLAKLARQHNDINVLVLRGRFGTNLSAQKMVQEFLNTPHLGGKYARRMKMIDE
ncbi:MAG: ribose 5-phosphate isomerase B [Clostridia bacterium]|nr:ribose 5-phosphate isomerase B [Clostridia bacterium]